jgi:hypothetical protein
MKSEFERAFRPGDYLAVSTPAGRVAMVFSNIQEGTPMPVAVRCAGAQAFLRTAGGTSDTDIATQHALFGHVMEGFHTAALRMRPGVVSSGATRIINGANAVMTILEIPRLVANIHAGCLTLGTAPRTTETMSLTGRHSTFVPSDKLDDTTAANPTYDLMWFVQTNASQASGWDGDVSPYFDLMDILKVEGAATGLWVWGGGNVTRKEIVEALQRGHPVGVVDGSGRVANDLCDIMLSRLIRNPTDHHNEFLNLQSAGQLDLAGVTVLNNPDDTRKWLIKTGLALAR